MPRSWTAGRADRVVPYSPGVEVRAIRAGVLLPPRDVLAGAADAVRAVLEGHAAAVSDARRAAFAITDDVDVGNLDALPARRCDTVVFLAGVDALERFVSWARGREWLPDLLLPASSAAPESLAGVPMKAWIALPTGPFDRTPRGLAVYRALSGFGTLRPEFPTL